MHNYFDNHKRFSKISARREAYAATKEGKYTTFLFAIFCFLPVLPDVICIRILYRKISFRSFVAAVIIGKCLTFLPIIFLGK